MNSLRLPKTQVQKPRRIQRSRPQPIRSLSKVTELRRRVVVVKVRIDRSAQGNRIQPGQFRFQGRNQAGELLEGLAALLWREGRPCWEGGLRGGDGFVDVCGGGFADWMAAAGSDVVSIISPMGRGREGGSWVANVP